MSLRKVISRKLGSGSDADGKSNVVSRGEGLAMYQARTSSSGASSLSDKDAQARERAIESLKTASLPSDPVEFAIQALMPIMSFNPAKDPTTMQDLADYHVPRYFAKDYRHQLNTNVSDLRGYLNRLEVLRQNMLTKARVRLLASVIDTAEQQSMQLACVCLQYEWNITLQGREDETRLRGTGIWNIKDGKLTDAIIVVDTKELNAKGPELSCIIS